jgi:hypothetical protein
MCITCSAMCAYSPGGRWTGQAGRMDTDQERVTPRTLAVTVNHSPGHARAPRELVRNLSSVLIVPDMSSFLWTSPDGDGTSCDASAC